MRTTTGRFQAEQLWDAADLARQHLPEPVPMGMDRDLWIRSRQTDSHSPSTGNGARHHA